MDGTFESSGNNPMYQRSVGIVYEAVEKPSDVRLKGVLENVTYRLVLLLTFFLPFFFIPTAWTSVPQAKSLLVIIFIVVALLAWIATALTEGVFRVPRSALLFAALLVPMAYLVSALAAGASHLSFIGGGSEQDTVVAVILWYVLFVVCANVLGTSSERLISVIRMLTAGGALVLLIQIVRLAFPSFTFGDAFVSQVSSALGSWHDLGIFLGLLLFFSLAFLSTSVATGRSWKLLLIGTAATSGFLLLVVNFQDVWLALSILSLVYGGYLWYVSRGQEGGGSRFFQRGFLWWIILGAAALGLYFGGTALQGKLPAPLQVTQIEVRPSWQGTLAIGSGVFTQPGSIFFGSGPNTFPREWGMHKPLSVNTTQFWNIDFYAGVGFIPTSFVTVGLLGAVAWGAVCLALLLSVWIVIRRRGTEPGGGMVPVVLAGAIYLATFHILYVPGPALSALLFLVFGILVASEILAGSTKTQTWSLHFDSWKGRASIVVIVIFGLLISFGEVQSVRALVSDMLVNRAIVVYNTTRDFTRASKETTAALAIFPKNDRAHRAAVELGLLQLSELSASGDTSEAVRVQLQSTLNATIEHGLTAVAIEGGNYQNWLSLARLYGELAGAGVEGAEEQARTAYGEAQKNNPTNPLPLLGLAQIDLLSGNEETARELLTAALQIKPDLVAAIFLLSQIEARANNLPAAREAAEAVASLASQDPLGWYNLGTIYYAGGDFQNASLAFERAAGLQNDYANALFLLSASYTELNRIDDALTALKAVAALNPTQESLQAMITALEAGKNPFRATVEE